MPTTSSVPGTVYLPLPYHWWCGIWYEPWSRLIVFTNTRRCVSSNVAFLKVWFFMKVHWLVCSYTYKYMGVSKIGVPQNGRCIMENPIKMNDLGVPLFSETSIYTYEYIYIYYVIHMSIFEEIFWAKLQVQDEHHWSLQFAASRSHPFDSPPPRRVAVLPSWEGMWDSSQEGISSTSLKNILNVWNLSLKFTQSYMVIIWYQPPTFVISAPSRPIVDGSEIQRSPPGMYIKPVVKNGIFVYILPYQLVIAGFLNHQQYHNTLVAELCTSGSANP